MADFLHTLHLLFQHQAWLGQSLITLIVCLVLTYLARGVHGRFLPRLEKTHQVWDNTLLAALYRPVIVFIWLFGFSVIYEDIGAAINLWLVNPDKLQIFLTIVFFLWFALRYISKVQDAISQRVSQGDTKTKLDVTTVGALGQMIRIVVIILTLLVGMQALGISINALLAFGGVGGIAVGFAAKDSLANFLGGMMIFIDRPFSVGDWIRSPDKNIEGTVDHIGWRLTRIITFDKRPLYVPNGTFSTISVENPSRMTNRRIKTHIGLRYADAGKAAVILKDIEDMLRIHPEIDTNQTLMVNIDQLAESAINFFIYTFTKTTNWIQFQAIQQDVLLKVFDIIDQHGAECAYPTRTVELIQPEEPHDRSRAQESA